MIAMNAKQTIKFAQNVTTSLDLLLVSAQTNALSLTGMFLMVHAQNVIQAAHLVNMEQLIVLTALQGTSLILIGLNVFH
jgi:hypothetical protein